MTEQILNEFMAYLDAMADALEHVAKLQDRGIMGFCSPGRIQLCPTKGDTLDKLFNRACEKLGLVPHEKRYTHHKDHCVERSIEYRGLYVFTFDYDKEGKTMTYRCDDCGNLFEEPETVREPQPYGESVAHETRNVSPCCHESYEKAVPCAICGEYDEQEDFECEVCPSCMDQGIEDHFMQYLNDGDADLGLKREFYLGSAFNDGGYPFTAEELILICEREYKEWLSSEFVDSQEIKSAWTRFINDGDPSHFAEFLIARKESHNA